MTLTTKLLPALALCAALAPAAALAQNCAADLPASSRERRAQAKEYFSKAEAAETAGDAITALKAYQCSLKMVPHAFTAFNLAKLAEKTGDLELAVESYGAYLKLSPEAQDRTEIEARITSLTARISALRAEPAPSPPPPPAPLPVRDTPPPSEEPPGSAPAHRSSPGADDEAAVSPVVWVLAGVSAAALVGGVVLNLGARGKMDDCRKLASTDKAAAQSACDAAKPRAYGSYALLGVGLAAAAVDVALIVTGSKKSDRELSLAPLPGGAAVIGRFRF